MPLSRRRFLANSALLSASSLLPRTLFAQQGAPTGQPDAYVTPKPYSAGPFQPTWESLRDNYTLPAWFHQAKFGIFIHWGLYSIPAHHNEWYERHMYHLHAIGYKYPAEATIRSLSSAQAKVERVTLLGANSTPLRFRQTAEALIVTMPPAPQSSLPYTLRIEGSQPLGAS